jgi:hypothetical protein
VILHRDVPYVTRQLTTAPAFVTVLPEPSQ